MYIENLKKIRQHYKLSVAKMAEKLDMSAGTLTGYERGVRTPTVPFFILLYEKLNVNLNWLVSGKGEMFNAPTYEQVEDELTQKVEAILKKNGLMK